MEIIWHICVQVDCESVFAIDLLSYPSGAKPPTWKEASPTYKDMVSHSGKVAIKEFYFDDTKLSFGREEVKTFSKADMETLSMYNDW